MDNTYYTALTNYFSTLSKFGYKNYKDVFKIMLLRFYKKYVYDNMQHVFTEEEYRLIERALDCVFGTTCLIPYNCYVMDRTLIKDQLAELLQRVENVENQLEEIPDNIVTYDEDPND